MNYYLVPESIAESLQLKELRKSTGDGLYLLSEYDLQPYGIERAENEGAVELSLQRKPIPGQEPEEQQVNANAQEEPVEEPTEEVEESVEEVVEPVGEAEEPVAQEGDDSAEPEETEETPGEEAPDNEEPGNVEPEYEEG